MPVTRNTKKKIELIIKATKRKLFRTQNKLILNGYTEAPSLKIPKSKLLNAIKILDEPKKKDTCVVSCHRPIHLIGHRKYDVTKNMNPRLLQQARLSVLKRDWILLAKILCNIKPMTRDSHQEFLAIFLKYATIFLYHNYDEDVMDAFLKLVGQKDEHEFYKYLACFSDNES